MKRSYIFNFNQDTFIFSSQWKSKSKIISNGIYLEHNAEHFNCNPQNAAQFIIEQYCNSKNININQDNIKEQIKKALEEVK